jgi:hypothetical protein
MSPPSTTDVPFLVGYIACTNPHFLEVTFKLFHFGLLLPLFFQFLSVCAVNFLPFWRAHTDLHVTMLAFQLYRFIFRSDDLGANLLY